MKESRQKEKREEEREGKERIKKKIGEVVRTEQRRYRLEVAKENGQRNTAGQITETGRRREHGHQNGGKNI